MGTSLSHRHKFILLLDSLSPLLPLSWVTGWGLVIGKYQGVWGSLSALFLVRHILAHEAKCVTACGCLADAWTCQAECLSSPMLETLSCEQKKQAWEELQAVIQIIFSCTFLPLRRRRRKCVAGCSKGCPFATSCKGRMLFSREEILKTLTLAIWKLLKKAVQTNLFSEYMIVIVNYH